MHRARRDAPSSGGRRPKGTRRGGPVGAAARGGTEHAHPPLSFNLSSPISLHQHDLDNYLAKYSATGHIWTVLKTPSEILQDLAVRIKARRVALSWPQLEAAQRAGVAYRTWRRLETEGQASLEDMVKAAVALRCEDALGALFPLPAASSLDALLAQQAAGTATRPARVRAPRSRSAKAQRP